MNIIIAFIFMIISSVTFIQFRLKLSKLCSTLLFNCLDICEIPANRISCGWAGMTKDQCLKKGCCWDQSIADTPWCSFYKNGSYLFQKTLVQLIQFKSKS